MRKAKPSTSAKNTRSTAARPARRSPKAGSPPADVKGSPRVRRRQKSAHGNLSKGTTIFETDHGPRAAWPASASKRRKR
jgi:hypothetical protein